MTSWLQKSGGAGSGRQSCLFESLGRLCLSLELSPERSVKITELGSKRSRLSFCISWSVLEPLSADDVPLKVVKNISNRSLRHAKIADLPKAPRGPLPSRPSELKKISGKAMSHREYVFFRSGHRAERK